MSSAVKDQASALRYVGQQIGRKEDARLLTGRGRYVDDVSMPGMLHAAFVRSPYARANIKSIDLAAARALPGVHAVYTAADLNGMVKSMRPMFYYPDANCPEDYLPLAVSDVRFAGDPVVLIVADDRYIAEDAADLVDIEYEEQPPLLDYLAAESAPPVHPGLKGNLIHEAGSPPDAELDAVFAKAPHVVEAIIDQQNYLAVPMETRGILASWLGPEELSIWMACQGPQFGSRYFSIVFGMPMQQIRVQAQDVGGGFGEKGHPMRDEVAVVCAAKKIGRPVKWIEDRMENLAAGPHSRRERATARMAFDKDGHILAARYDHMANNGAYPWMASDGVKAAETFPGPYRMPPRYGWRVRSYYTNTAGRGAYRGPWMMETTLREVLMDKAARQLGIDGIELRRRNVIMPADQPYTTVMKQKYEAVSPEKTLEQAVDMADFPAFRAQQAAARKQGRYLGIGLSLYMEPTAMPAQGSNVAQIRIEPTGEVVAVCNTAAQGHGTETTMAMVIADELGVDIKNVRILQGDSNQTAYGFGAGGSRQAVVGGGAAIIAATALRKKVLEIAAHLLETGAQDLTIKDGNISVVGVPQLSIPLKKVAETAYFGLAKLPPGMEPGLEAQHRYAPERTTYANAAHACVVEVDVETGMVKLLRWIASEDCGVMINPGVVAGQVAGGLAQAIGGVLIEDAPYDAMGNPLAVTFKDYLMPLISMMPEIEFGHVVTPSVTPGGFKGVGEGGAIIGPSVLINAVTDALAPFGVDCTHLPLTPSKLLAGIESGRQRTSKDLA